MEARGLSRLILGSIVNKNHSKFFLETVIRLILPNFFKVQLIAITHDYIIRGHDL